MERPATAFAEVYKFRFGTYVTTEDGELSTLVQVVVDPAARVVVGIGVRFRLFGAVHFIPYEHITDANSAGGRINLTRDDVEQKMTEKAPFPALTSNTRVLLDSKRLGTLTQVTVVRETGALRHLIVSRGVRNEVVVGAEDITSIEANQIHISPSMPGGVPVTPYRPDAELHDEIRQTLENYNRLRVDVPGMGIRVVDGNVWLQGYVSSDLNKRLAEDVLSGTRGIAHLQNELVPDTQLAANVSMALAKDPRTAEEKIGVYPSLGNVRLRGMVRTPVAREAAGAVAREVPHVRSVENELHVNPNASVLPVLASVTNTDDIVPGGD